MFSMADEIEPAWPYTYSTTIIPTDHDMNAVATRRYYSTMMPMADCINPASPCTYDTTMHPMVDDTNPASPYAICALYYHDSYGS